MAVPTLNLEAIRGGLVAVSIQVTEQDGTPSDLTGYTGQMQVRAAADDEGSPLATGVVTLTPSTGVVLASLASASTEALYVAGHTVVVYDVRITPGGGEYEYVVAGQVKIRPGVTR